MDTYEAEVAEILDETAQDRTFVLALIESDGWAQHRPGQYVLVTDPDHPEGPPCGFTISSAPRDDGRFEITVRNAGRCGNQLHSYEPGKRLHVTAPAGNFVLELEAGQHLVMIGAGSGVTPFRAYLQHLAAIGHQGPCCLLQSSHSEDDMLFHSEFEAASRSNDWLRYIPTLTGAAGDDWTGACGRLDQGVLQSCVPDPERTLVYACGPTAFVDEMLACAEALGVPKDALRREAWG